MMLHMKLQDSKQELLLVVDYGPIEEQDLALVLQEAAVSVLRTYRQKKYPMVDGCVACVEYVSGRTNKPCEEHYPS
jgi:hypothetical protein